MKIINHIEIENGLKDSGRVYLCGDLQRSNGVEHIKTDGYEIGISEYPEFKCDKPHYHAFNNEFNFVIAGQVKVILINEKKEYLFSAGDLFVIEPNEPYIGKNIAGTRVLFSKSPGGDDKVLVEKNEALIRWSESWEAEYREGEAE